LWGSSQFKLRHLETRSIENATENTLAVSRLGTLAAAIVETNSSGTFTLISMYGAWERPIEDAASWIYADASVHRMISDISALVSTNKNHHIIAAGDLNILRGYGEDGSTYWRDRYQTVFTRMEAIGLQCVGPEQPNGAKPSSSPKELPKEAKTLPPSERATTSQSQPPDSSTLFLFRSR
jgi:hypothetical protein